MTRGYRAVVLSVLLVVSTVGVVAATPAAASHDGSDCEFPVSVTDDTETSVTLEEPAEEVVVLDAASAQTFWEIGAEDRIVGMPLEEWTTYLEGSAERTDVTDDGVVVLEQVVELDADLVVAPNFIDDGTIEQLREANQTVYRTGFEESFEDIYAKTELYGHFVGECEAAEQTATETRTEVEEIREAVADREEPRVLYYFFEFAAGDGTFIGDMVETAGGENVAATANLTGFQQISEEVIVEADPEWIVTTDDPGSIDTDAAAFRNTTAVRNDQVLEVDANLVSQAGPRVVEPLRMMAEAFHPEAFEETPAETPTPDDEQPGFGIAVAVGALLAAGVLRRR